MFTIAIHFYRLSCECEPRVYESLVDVLSTQCVKSFNCALHSALDGQYGMPKFRAKQACLNLQHKISSHHLVHFNDTQRSSILLPIFLFIFTLYESLVDVLSTQCVKSFNRALHSALDGQYGMPKFRAKQACLNLQHKISSHHLVHFNDTQRSSILLPIFLFIFTLL